MRLFGYLLATAISIALLVASWGHHVEFDFSEAAAVVAGAWCVWLTVKENIWNWPIGNVSSFYFFVTFLHQRLYADMTLQLVYIVLGFVGWYWWLHGGRDRSTLVVSKTTPSTALAIVVILAAATWAEYVYLVHIKDSAPFLDALTTGLSLAAQFMLTKKLIENWYVWITADIIYIGLYIYKHLYLSSGLYAVFIVMCVMGLRAWRMSMNKAEVASV